MECTICNTSAPPINAAIDAGWMPSYYDGDEECEGPICPCCVQAYMSTGDDGELESSPLMPVPVDYYNSATGRYAMSR